SDQPRCHIGYSNRAAWGWIKCKICVYGVKSGTILTRLFGAARAGRMSDDHRRQVEGRGATRSVDSARQGRSVGVASGWVGDVTARKDRPRPEEVWGGSRESRGQAKFASAAGSNPGDPNRRVGLAVATTSSHIFATTELLDDDLLVAELPDDR